MDALGIVASAILSSGGGGGGGGAPEWVPANAKIYIDMLNDRAWTAADGIVTIDTLLGADANTSEGWDTSVYDPAHLGVHGYGSVTDYLTMAFIGTLRTKMFTGCTLRLALENESGVTNGNFALLAADGNAAVEFDFDTIGGHVDGSSWSGTFSQSITSSLSNTTGDVNVIAITLTPTRAEFAANGSGVNASVLSTDDYPVSGDSPLVAAIVSVNAQMYLQTLTVYDTFADTTGLSALST